MKLRPIAQQAYLKMLIESISGDASAATSATEKLSQELERAGSDADEVEIQAAMLGALIDADGDIAAIDVSDVEKIKQDVEESRDYRIDESGSTAAAIGHVHPNFRQVPATCEEAIFSGLNVSLS